MTAPVAARPATYDRVYLAAPDHLDALRDELVAGGATLVDERERLVFARNGPRIAAWAQNSWLDPREIAIESIGDGARALRALQRNWHLHPVAHHRRARLIADRLPAIRFRALTFPCDPPAAPLGAWSLVERDRIVASPICSSPFADGVASFAEDRDGPPNRAYLKLWEALTLARVRPAAGQRCLDLGAAPGGWSWVLAQLGASVTSVDRAPLAPALARHPAIRHHVADAFALRLEDLPTPDWICSDVIAYPRRLLALARYWCAACPDAAIVLTVKHQGTVDPAAIAPFLDIPGARIMHLSANKHELTFFRLPGGGPAEARTGAGRSTATVVPPTA